MKVDDGGNEDLLKREAERLIERRKTHPEELRQELSKHLEEGAEFLRRHHGWSRAELTRRLGLPFDERTEQYREFGTQIVGPRMVEFREIAGLTPGELAYHADVPIEILRLLEEGRDDVPDIDQLGRLAEVLDTNISFLLYWAERLADGNS